MKGIVEEVGTALVKVRLPELDNLVTDWLPVMQPVTLGARAWLVPRKGSVVVLLPGLAGLDDAVVLGCLYNQVDTSPFSDPAILGIEADDGTLIQYDPQAHKLTIHKPDSIEIETTVIKVKGDLELTGKFTHTGDQQHTGNTSQTGDAAISGTTTLATLIVNGKNFLGHTHLLGSGNTGTVTP